MIRRPEDLPGAAARLRGHHATPGDIVLIGYRDKRLLMVQAFNIGDLPDGPGALAEACQHVAGHFRRERANVALLAFGDDEAIGPAFAAAATALDAGRQDLLTLAYRVTGTRMYCLICDDCAPGGLIIPARRGDNGQHDVAADRETISARYAPSVTDTMLHAAERTITKYALAFAHVADADQLTHEVQSAGIAAVDAALATASNGTTLNDEDAAWLIHLLTHDFVCRYAWLHATESTAGEQLWGDLVRRAPQTLTAPVAVLLAISALRRGNGLIANIAVEIAVAAQPGYPPLAW